MLAWTESHGCEGLIRNDYLAAMLGGPVQKGGAEQPQTKKMEVSNSGAGLSVQKGEADDEQD